MNGTSVAAAVEVAKSHGVRCDEPVVLREAWHVLVHLRPSPIVARVSSSLPYPRGPDPEDVVRELEVASHAAAKDAPVIPPSTELPAGPHRHGGHIVTFWRYIDAHPDPDPAEAGRRLRVVHEALADYGGALPDDHLEDTRALLDALGPTPETDLLRAVVAEAPHGGGQAIHGDAHLGNCLGSSRGPLWHDLETACRGPREYDLAALISRDRVFGDRPGARRALAAYGDYDEAVLEAMLPLYLAWVTASMLIALPRRPELGEAVAERVRWLRSVAGQRRTL